MTTIRRAAPCAACLVLTLADDACAAPAAAASSRSLWDLVVAGGPVGWTILLLSLVAAALVVNGFLLLRPQLLVPPGLATSIVELARKGRFEEILNLCRAQETLLGRVVASGLAEHKFGVEAVREGMEQQGGREITRLRHRTNWIGLIAAIAPMLGLLGTVTGMIGSFRLLGESPGAARPEELALGISQALVTTCMGLILAVPLTFLHVHFRDRITRIGQDAGETGSKVLRIMTYLTDKKQASRS